MYSVYLRPFNFITPAIHPSINPYIHIYISMYPSATTPTGRVIRCGSTRYWPPTCVSTSPTTDPAREQVNSGPASPSVTKTSSILMRPYRCLHHWTTEATDLITTLHLHLLLLIYLFICCTYRELHHVLPQRQLLYQFERYVRYGGNVLLRPALQ